MRILNAAATLAAATTTLLGLVPGTAHAAAIAPPYSSDSCGNASYKVLDSSLSTVGGRLWIESSGTNQLVVCFVIPGLPGFNTAEGALVINDVVVPNPSDIVETPGTNPCTNVLLPGFLEIATAGSTLCIQIGTTVVTFTPPAPGPIPSIELWRDPTLTVLSQALCMPAFEIAFVRRVLGENVDPAAEFAACVAQNQRIV